MNLKKIYKQIIVSYFHLLYGKVFLSKVTIKKREIVTSDTKGDPKIYKLILNLKYEKYKNGELVTQDKLEKQISYNSIKDKYELSQYEDNILKNLSTNLTNDILFALEILIKWY